MFLYSSNCDHYYLKLNESSDLVLNVPIRSIVTLVWQQLFPRNKFVLYIGISQRVRVKV